MLYMSTPRNKSYFYISKRCSNEHAAMSFFQNVSEYQPLPIFAQHLFPAKAVDSYSAFRFSGFNQQMHFRIMPKGFKMAHSLNGGGNRFFIDNAAGIKIHRNSKSVLYKAFQHLRLNFAHKMNIYLPCGVAAYQKLGVFFLDLLKLW